MRLVTPAKFVLFQSVKDAHREDVRKRLAMNTPGEGSYGEVYTRASNSKPYRAQNSAMELYVNDCNEEVFFYFFHIC